MSYPRTSAHPNAIGNGSKNAIFSKRFDYTATNDDDSPNCLYISYNQDVAPAATPSQQPRAGTVQVDGNGAGTQCRITLRVENVDASGDANSDISYTIDCDGSAKTDWSSGAAVAYTLKDIIDLINEDDAGGTNGKFLAGFRAWIGEGGMYDLIVTGAAQFRDESEKYIKSPGSAGGYTGFLKRDLAIAGGAASDSDYYSIWRIGMPEARDRGMFKILDLYGTVTADTGDQVSDNAGIMVVRDDVKDFVEPVGTWATDIANHEFVYHVDRDNFPTNAGSTSYNFNHKPDEAAMVRGPVVLIIKHDTDYDTNSVHVVAQLQAAGL